MVIYYVYELCFPEGKPFYVGKGSDDGSRKFHRAHFHWRKHQLVKTLIRSMKDRGEQPLIKVVFESASEDAAFAEETRRIALYGRRFAGGLLWNVADGGRGGPRGKPLTAEHKAKIGAANAGRKRSPEARERMRRAHLGKKLSTEHVRKAADAARGRRRGPMSDEQKAKISATKRSHAEKGDKNSSYLS